MAENKYSSNPISSRDDDWGLDKNDEKQRPYSGQAVQDYIKETFNSKIGFQKFYEDEALYRYFATREDADLYDSDRDTYSGLVLAQHEGQNPYYAVINLESDVVKHGVPSNATGTYLNFSYDIRNSRSNQSTGDSALCKISVTNNGLTKTKTLILSNPGEYTNFLLDDYLQEGTNSVIIVVTGQKYTVSTQVAVTYLVFNIDFQTNLDITKYYTDEIKFSYSITSTQEKYIEAFIDGSTTNCLTEDVIVATSVSDVTRYLSVSELGLTEGLHTIQFRSYIFYGDTKYYSKTHFYQFYVGKPADVEFGVKTELSEGTLLLNGLSLTAKQYLETTFSFATVETKSRTLSVEVRDNDDLLTTISTTYGELQTYSYTPIKSGSHVLTLSCNSTTLTIPVTVSASSLGIDEASENGLVLRLFARGRSNSETNKDVWKYGNYSATFNNKVLFGSQDGWQTDDDGATALVLKNGGVMEINIDPFPNETTTTGKTIEIEFSTDDVEDDSAELVSCVSSTGAGLKITTCSASLTSVAGISTSSKFKPRERQKIAFVISKKANTTYSCHLFTILNGVLCFPAKYASNDSFSNAVGKITFGNADGNATLKIYSIRIYNRALTFDEELGNYIVDSTTPESLASSNDVLVNNSTVSFDKLKNILPTLMITCVGVDNYFDKILNATDKSTAISAVLSYTHPDDPTLNFTAGEARIRKQGTSSLMYPRPNLKIDHMKSALDYNGEALPEFGKKKYQAYQFKHDCAPCQVYTWKTDFMDSSMSHNTGVARLWNDIMYNVTVNGEHVCQTKAQKAALDVKHPYDVRTCVDGFPAVIFYRNEETGTPVFLGLYNFNTDKSDLGTFGWAEEGDPGYIDGYDASSTECWEFLSEGGLCLMNSADEIEKWDTVVSYNSETKAPKYYWENYFEERQPEQPEDGDFDSEEMTKNIKAFVEWVYSTKDDFSKWQAEKADHIDEWKMAAYYIYIMYFAAVDQVTKNSMLIQEGDGRWFFINYDNDTINGVNNEGRLIFDYDIDRSSLTSRGETSYAFAGHDSVLFNNFEKDSEFMGKVSTLATAMYNVGLSYDTVIDMFVNNQSKAFPERLHNASQEFKYLQPSLTGTNYLYACHGTRESHVKYFYSKRSELYESIWGFGSYMNRTINFRCEAISKTDTQKKKLTIVAGNPGYYGIKCNTTGTFESIKAAKGDTVTLSLSETSETGDIYNITGASNIEELNFSNQVTVLAVLSLVNCYDEKTGTKLKRLIISNSGDGVNTALTTLSDLNKCIALEELDFRRYKSITSIDIETLKNLHIVRAADSGLTSFSPADGVTLTEVSLPSCLSSISLNDVTIPTSGTWDYTPTTSLRSVTMNKVKGLDTYALMYSWISAIQASSEALQKEIFASSSITLKDINWTGVDASFMLYLKNNFLSENVNMTGYVLLNKLSTSEYKQILAAYGENIFSAESTLRFDAPENIFIEATGVTNGVMTSGKSAQVKATIFPLSTTSTSPTYRLYNSSGYVATYDSTSNTYTQDNITLDASTGKLTTVRKETDTVCYVDAYKGTLESEKLMITVSGVVHPTEATIDLTSVTDQSSDEWTSRDIKVTFGPSGYTVTPVNPVVQIKSGSSGNLQIVKWDASTYTLTIRSLRPKSAEETSTLAIYWTADDQSYSTEATITLNYIPVNSITITGPDTFTSEGAEGTYTLSFSPSNANVKVTDWSITIGDGQSV